MAALIHILHLEDDPMDAELVRAGLAEAGLNFRITHVRARDEFEAALHDEEIDIILGDYHLPMYDGMSALRLTLERRPDVPFVFVTGAIGDEAGVEALTRGAADYVLKQNPVRLAPAVRRALQEARCRRERMDMEDRIRRQYAQLRCLIDALGDLVYIKDTNSVYQGCNKAAEAFIGIPERDQIGKTDFDFFEQEKAEAIRADDRRVFASGKTFRTEEWVTRRDGGQVLMDTLKAPYYSPDGEILGLVGIGRDITEVKQAEIRQEEQLHFFQQLLDSIPIPVYYKDREGYYLGCNAAFEAFTGLASKDIVGKTVYDVAPEERADKHHEADLALLRQSGVQAYEISGIYKDGRRRDLIFNKATFVDAYDRVAGTVGALIDITERKESERERLASLRFFESMDRINRAIQRADDLEKMMKDLLDVVMSIFDCDRAFLMYPCDPEAPAWSSPMERGKPEYPGVRDLKIEIPMDPQVAGTLRILLAADGPVAFGPGAPHALPEDVSKQFGVKCFLSMAVYPKTGGPWQFGIHQCAYARVWTEEEMRVFEAIGRRLADGLSSLLSYRDLRKNEEFLDNVIEHIPDMIFVKDTQTLRFVRLNKAGEQLLGYSREELLGKTDYDVFPGQVADFFTAGDYQALHSGELVNIPEGAFRTRNNEERILHIKKMPVPDETGTPQYLLGIFEDITERKQLEDQLRQLQKMEAIGQLAGGVAHDFNNMLGVIIGSAELALAKAARDAPLRKNLEEILVAGRRSADITRQLLTFARKQTITPRILDLNEAVKGMLKLLCRLIGEDINLSWLPGAKLWPVKMDPSQIDQILANLCVNARDAIAGVGRISIETETVTCEPDYCARHPEFVPGEYVSLMVSDDGCGLDQETLGKIFEPFFTTKEAGKGTGLGLATVYGIVKQNNGFIYVYSEPGQGTSFRIYLPRHEVEAGEARKQDHSAPPPGGREIILLVEDEHSILEITELMLEELGYRVFCALTPGEAIRLANAHHCEIDLLITDVIMPEMNGRDLANQVAALYPEMACLFMSGYPGDFIAHHGVLDKCVHLIQKPFSMRNLAVKVREVLDSK